MDEIAPSLGRNLSSGNVTVNLVEPGTLYGERRNNVDLRIAKIFRYGRTRTQVGVDVYNLFNANPGLTYNQSFVGNGQSWYTPTSLLMPRFVRFNVTVDF